MVEVIDQTNTTLGYNYISEQDPNVCNNIPELPVSKGLIGIRCLSCSETTILEPSREVLGVNVVQYLQTGLTSTAYKDNTLNFDLIGYKSCKSSIELFTKLFLTIIIMIGILLLLLVGLEQFKKRLFDDFEEQLGSKE